MWRHETLFLWLCVGLLFPAAAYGQASIAGVVKDTSGAVLPGVTVEAASPVLIEKSRTAVTDGAGLYRLVDLKPGPYTVTFTLTGFSTVKRERIELSGSFTATVNVDMQVGAVEETIVVSADSPIVDVQSAGRQRVIDTTQINELPVGRSHQTLAVLIPGVNTSSTDVGGTSFATGVLTGHGSKTGDQRVMQLGLNWSSIRSSGQTGLTVPNLGAYQEVTIDYAGANAEAATSGVRVNLIPRDGGNTIKGMAFWSFANASMQGRNLTPELRDRGLPTPNSIRSTWEINPSVGGPVIRDRLWFHYSYRNVVADNYVAGMFPNLNAGNATSWTYSPGTEGVSNHGVWRDNADLRLTWQVTSRHRLGVMWTDNVYCTCPTSNIAATRSPDAALSSRTDPWTNILVDWANPVSSRLLLDAVMYYRYDLFTNDRRDGTESPDLISVTEQGGQIPNLIYRAAPLNQYWWVRQLFYRMSVSYVSGSHAMKVGVVNTPGHDEFTSTSFNPLSYRFNNGVPNLITMQATPYTTITNVTSDLGIYAQDKWTLKRMTVTGGLRFDHFATSFPEQLVGPAPLAPNRQITFPAQDNLRWNDITPKSQVVYDLFGNGKTALKVSLNKYVAGYGSGNNSGTLLSGSPNPVATLVTTTTRSWADNNRNFVPDCDLTNLVAQGPTQSGSLNTIDGCGAAVNSNFGSAVPGAQIDPDIRTGWGKRDYNWEFSVGAQREILQRVSLDVAYFRKWYGNFQVTDDLARAPGDFDPFSVTAPRDARLPGGGGYAIGGFLNVNEAKFSVPARNLLTLARNYGTQIEHWNGVDVSVSARLPRLLAQGGISSGRTYTDSCEVLARLPEMSPLGAPYCRQQTPFVSDVKGLVTYTLPRIDVQVAGTFQSKAGPALSANLVVANAAIVPSLGRSLSGGTSNQTVGLINPAAEYGDRLNQFDLRIGKVIRSGRTRSSLNVDVYNVLNAGTVLTENPAYTNATLTGWRRPTLILPARFVKLNLQFDF